MRALVRRLRREESGLTLLEIMVSAVLTIIFMVTVGGMMIQVALVSTRSNEITNSNALASNVSNAITSTIRMSTNLPKTNVTVPDPAVVAGTRSSLTVYSYLDTDPHDPYPIKVTIALDAAGVVKETRCTGSKSNGYWTFSSCTASTTRVLGEGVLQPGGAVAALFTYRTANGTPIDIGTNSLSASQRALVTSITVNVTARAEGSDTDPVALSNTVTMRNLGVESTT